MYILYIFSLGETHKEILQRQDTTAKSVKLMTYGITIEERPLNPLEHPSAILHQGV